MAFPSRCSRRALARPLRGEVPGILPPAAPGSRPPGQKHRVRIPMGRSCPVLAPASGRRRSGNQPGGLCDRSPRLLARMSGIYAALKPYHLAVAAREVAEGLPPIRHPWMHYEADPRRRPCRYQYLTGGISWWRPLIRARRARRAPSPSSTSPRTNGYIFGLPEASAEAISRSRAPLGYPGVFYTRRPRLRFRCSTPSDGLRDAHEARAR